MPDAAFSASYHGMRGAVVLFALLELEPPDVSLLSMETECSQPIPIRKDGNVRLGRCRRCPQCLKAAQRYWAAAAANQIRAAESVGCRSWFGTCTFRPDVQAGLLTRALEASAATQVAWAESPPSERFVFLQQQALHEAQKYWKRLRKRGLLFKYLTAFEQDQSGRPHMHCLLHEANPDRPIRKRELEECWDLGFTNFKLLSPCSDGRLPHGAIMYVTKSLSKQRESRLCASFDYRPERRHAEGEQRRHLRLPSG